MPRGIGKLNNLQFLSDFVINKDQGAKIAELGGLPCLGKCLGIWNLESVSHSKEALEARMMDKSRLQVLVLEWSLDDDTMDSHNERDILDKLQPHSNLKRLIVKGYRGTRFPDWLGHPSYHGIVYLRLEDCRNCWMLPPLGQLPSLKELTIERFDRLVSVGADFFKNHDSSLVTVTPFSSLESLKFQYMSAWEDWCSIGMEAFPKLQKLTIHDCPKFRGDLPKHQHHLVLEQCHTLLRSCIPSSVTDLTISDSCDSLPSFSADNFSNLKHLKIRGAYDCVNCFPEDGLLTASLSSLKIQGFTSLETLDCEAFRHITALQEVTLRGCSKHEKMSIERLAVSVRSLKIEACHLIQAEELRHLSNVQVSSY